MLKTPAHSPRTRLRVAGGYVRRPQPRRRQRAPAPLRWLNAVVVLAVASMFVAGGTLDTAYQSRVLPGVHYETMALSGLTAAQVKDLLDAQRKDFLVSPAIFTYGDRIWRPTAAEMGLSIDTDAMANEAVSIGRTAPIGLRWPQLLLMPIQRPSIELRSSLDVPQLAAFLSAVALEIDRAPVSAALAVRNGQLVVGQPAAGRQVDIPETVKRVRAPRALDDLQQVPVAVTVMPPLLGEANIAEAQATATKILAAPLTLRWANRVWSLTPAQLGAMVDITQAAETGGAPVRLVASLNEARVAAYVKTLAAQIDRPAVNAQLRWTGNGVVLVREGSEGVKLDQAAAVKAIIAQALTDQREIALNVAVQKPAVSGENVAQLGIRELISSGTSRFAGSPPERINNIRVAAERLNGVVIPAGATFSFLEALGPITKENGYQEGLTIQGDATVPGIGGGVCQVSTTAFRAAFYAGLPIVERHQHAYRVAYYEQDGSPPGFDAAVYDPGVDLRFRNDTGAAILIHTAIDTSTWTLTFRFYGSPSGREVRLAATTANEVKAGPRLPDVIDPTLPRGTRKQLEWRADGLDATIRRTVIQGGQVLFTDSFFSRYAPWQEKWAVGSGPAA